MVKHIGLDMIFDTSEKGLLTLFKPYQAALMEHIWKLNNPYRTGITSGQAYEFQKDHPDGKSRASMIFFLNDMVEEGILTYEEKTGKGGYHRVYYPKMSREQFAQHVVQTITKKLKEVFPSALV
jgi:predicted transcriptional regulator